MRTGLAVSDRAAYGALAVCVVFAAWLRLPTLGHDSIWIDEAVSLAQSRGSIADILNAVARDNYPPLHNLILAASIHLFGESEWALRSTSALFGLLNIVAVYWVGRLVAGPLAGLFAAALLTFSGFHVWYSQEARSYALLALAATVFAGLSIRLWRRWSVPDAVFLALVGIALLYTHPYGATTWVSVAVAIALAIAIWQQPRGIGLAGWGALQALIFAAFLPWALVLARRAAAIHRDGFWIPYPTPAFVWTQLTEVASGAQLLALLAMFALVAVIPLAALNDDQPSSTGSRAIAPALTIVLVAWALLPAVIGYAISAATTPILVARYLIASLPAILILAGAGMARLATNRKALAIVAFGSALIVVPAININPGPRSDWRNAALAFDSAIRAGDCVVIFGDNGYNALSYYYHQPIGCIRFTASPAGVDPDEIPSDRVLFLLYSSGGRDVLDRFKAPLWTMVREEPFRGVDLAIMARARR